MNGSVIVEKTLQFLQVKYAATFVEAGLPVGTSWTVTLNGVASSTTRSTMEFSMPNGTYVYSITDISGWHQATIPYVGGMSVNGTSVVEQTLRYFEMTYGVTFTETGLPLGKNWTVTLNGVASSSTG